MYFGRIFGILAIFRSTRLLDEEPTAETTELVAQCAKELVNLFSTKRWLREICVQSLCTLLRNVHPSLIPTVLEASLPIFEEQRSTDEEDLVIPVRLSPASLLYLLQIVPILRQREVMLTPELSRVYLQNNAVEPNRLRGLMGVYKESVFTFPKLHPLWPATVEYIRAVAEEPEYTLMTWWTAVTEQVLGATTERRR